MELDPNSPACVFATLVAGSVLKVVSGYWFARNESKKYQPVGRVAALHLYPIKSFGGIELEQGDCTALGLSCFGVTDRHFAVATADGIYLTQRQEPTMVLIKVKIIGAVIQLSAPNMPVISLLTNPVVTASNISQITVKTDTIPSVDCGDEVAAWLCRYFNRKGLRLHFSAPSLEKRECMKNKKNWKHPAEPGDLTALSDYCGYMILSKGSLGALNQRLSTPVSVRNFRPNIIVDDCNMFEEDTWESVRIGNAQLRALDACTRCVLVTINPDLGVKDLQEEPLTTLKMFRKMEPYGDKPAFGVNFTLDKPGTIRVGDIVYARKGHLKVSPL